uniref:AsIV-cont00038-ORF1 n=1 Tax=Apophua simplicipes ichnovirus TaxID=1329648 RepID=S5DR51_9VIRU|nr:AsIV-cont00038-ORF1 [Apophua simplicipes ichnovirus]
MEYIVDLHNLIGANDQFVLKQFALLRIDDEEVGRQQFTVKPPYPLEDLTPKTRYLNSYPTRYIHGLSWDSGVVPYEQALKRIRRLLRDASTIYVRGSKKKEWLSRLVRRSTKIIDLEDLDCPAAIDLRRYYCRNLKRRLGHTVPCKEYLTTLQIVRLQKRWMMENKVIPKPKTDSILDKCIERLINFAIGHFQPIKCKPCNKIENSWDGKNSVVDSRTVIGMS